MGNISGKLHSKPPCMVCRHLHRPESCFFPAVFRTTRPCESSKFQELAETYKLLTSQYKLAPLQDSVLVFRRNHHTTGSSAPGAFSDCHVNHGDTCSTPRGLLWDFVGHKNKTYSSSIPSSSSKQPLDKFLKHTQSQVMPQLPVSLPETSSLDSVPASLPVVGFC